MDFCDQLGVRIAQLVFVEMFSLARRPFGPFEVGTIEERDRLQAISWIVLDDDMPASQEVAQ